MAVVVAHFLKPTGLIEPTAMFPDESINDINTRIDSYITQGEAKSLALPVGDTQDQAITAWVYYRAFNAVYIGLLASPLSAAIADQGSTVYSFHQVKEFDELSKQYLAIFTGLINSDTPLTPGQRAVSASVAHSIKY